MGKSNKIYITISLHKKDENFNLYKADFFIEVHPLTSLNQSFSKNIFSHIYLDMMGLSVTIKSLFTGVSVLFNEAKLEQHMLHFKL